MSSSKKGAPLGQHFLRNRWAATALARAVGVRPGEAILEVGPGKGALTKELLAFGRVIAVEKDERLVAHLEDVFAGDIASGRLTVTHADIRDVSPESLGLSRYVLAANIPYYLTGEIIRRFLTAKRQPRAMALLVQKEVAERIVARGGKESILSLSVKAYGTPRIVKKVGRGNFSPPPSVDSAILFVDEISRHRFLQVDERAFFDVVRAGFSSKRKKLLNNLAAFGKEKAARALAACGISERVRAEDLALPAWLRLSREIRSAS